MNIFEEIREPFETYNQFMLDHLNVVVVVLIVVMVVFGARMIIAKTLGLSRLRGCENVNFCCTWCSEDEFEVNVRGGESSP